MLSGCMKGTGGAVTQLYHCGIFTLNNKNKPLSKIMPKNFDTPSSTEYKLVADNNSSWAVSGLYIHIFTLRWHLY